LLHLESLFALPNEAPGTKGGQLGLHSVNCSLSDRRGQTMNIGTVRWFNLEKGRGYIHPDDGSPNIFVEGSAVEGAGLIDLKTGQKDHF
jgi:cold shock CspA family protein